MGEEEREDTPADPERTGLAERERHDQELADVNRKRQARQGVFSEGSEEEEEEPPAESE